MSQNFQSGDFLIFQLESGYGLLRVLAIEEQPDDTIWHLAAYSDLFLDVEMADAALDGNATLSVSRPHLALTNRAFESTQVARMRNVTLAPVELVAFDKWKQGEDRKISDRSVRLLLGLR
ncbi:MAG: hypothetical protein WBD22_04755 [Pyrinomonadaceae bacterium]